MNWNRNPVETELTKNYHAVEEYPTENGPADYAFFVEGKLLGLLEAKRVKVGAQNVLEQAKRYSRGVNRGMGSWGEYRVPFLYASNGENVYFVDVRHNKNISTELSNFHTYEAIIFCRGLSTLGQAHTGFSSTFSAPAVWSEGKLLLNDDTRQTRHRRTDCCIGNFSIRIGRRSWSRPTLCFQEIPSALQGAGTINLLLLIITVMRPSNLRMEAATKIE